MKRDMDLARAILLALEDSPDVAGGQAITVDGVSDLEVSYHVKLLHDAGLIEAFDFSDQSDFKWVPQRLTWDGHEFLEAARSETIWIKAKQLVTDRVGGISFDVLKAVLVDLAKKAVIGD